MERIPARQNPNKRPLPPLQALSFANSTHLRHCHHCLLALQNAIKLAEQTGRLADTPTVALINNLQNDAVAALRARRYDVPKGKTAPTLSTLRRDIVLATTSIAVTLEQSLTRAYAHRLTQIKTGLTHIKNQLDGLTEKAVA